MPQDLVLVPLSTLPQANSVNPWDVFPIVQNGVTKIASAEKLPGAAVSPGVQTDTGSATINVTAGKLMAFFVIRCSATGAFNLGSTAGGNDWLEAETIPAADTWYVYQFMRYGGDDGLPIYFSSLPGLAEIKLFYLG